MTNRRQRVGIVSDPSCRCGDALENLKHFFLDCPIYIQARTKLIGNINRVTTCYTLDIEFLTCGNDNLTYEQNCIIFKYVMKFIRRYLSDHSILQKITRTLPGQIITFFFVSHTVALL
jgi:hypothetical protein